jgi:hypothetical protein
MPFSGKVGDSFYLPDAGGGHRYVILTNPNSEGKVIIVNFTDVKNVHLLPVFTPRDDSHLFTKHSSVNYAFAQLVVRDRLIANKVDRWGFCNLSIIRKIIVGAFQSQHTPIYIIKELRVQYLEEYKKYHTWDIDKVD